MVYCSARLGAACWRRGEGEEGLPGAGEAMESSLLILQVACYVEGDASETAKCMLSGSSHDEEVKC